MPKVKIYSTTWCHWCGEEKDYLDSKGVKYDYVEVDTDPKEAEEYQRVSEGAQGVPFTLITQDDGKTVGVLGFDKPKLNAALGIQG